MVTQDFESGRNIVIGHFHEYNVDWHFNIILENCIYLIEEKTDLGSCYSATT